MQMKWLVGIGAVGLLLVLAGLAGAWWFAAGRAPLRFSPPPQPQIAWVEFARGDGSEPTIRLAGWSNFHFELLFPGFRDEATPKFAGASDATWLVTIVDTDARKWNLAVRSQSQGQVWQSGATAHPIQGDLDLFVQAHAGIEILNLASSADPADRQRLEEVVAAAGDDAIDALLALARSTEDRERAIALCALNMVLSPRLRRVARLNAGVDECEPNDTVRAVDHPRAADVRELAVSILEAWSADPSVATSFSMTESALFETLAELRDQDIADKLAAALQKRPDADYPAEEIMRVLEEVYGLPPVVEPLGICPVGESEANLARAAAAAHSRRQQRRLLLLAWHDIHRGLPREAQLQAAVAAWEPIIAERDPQYLVGYPIHVQSTFRPILVQGTDVLPALTDAQERAPGLSRQAVYEALITIISGQRDDAFLTELLQGDPLERELGRKISAIPTAN